MFYSSLLNLPIYGVTGVTQGGGGVLIWLGFGGPWVKTSTDYNYFFQAMKLFLLYNLKIIENTIKFLTISSDNILGHKNH